jgi:hypothetical protein
MSPRTADRIIIGAFLTLLLTTCVAGTIAAHYRAEVRQLKAQDCTPAAPLKSTPLPVAKRRITA